MKTDKNKAYDRKRTYNRGNVKPTAAKKTKKKKPGQLDYTFLTIVIVIVCAGLVMLLSASSPAASKKFGNPYRLFLKQLIFACLGFVFMLFISRIDYHRYKKHTKQLMIVCIVMLAMVFLPIIGVEHNGSRRWINLIVTEFQPSELMKPAIAMFFAAEIESKRHNLRTLPGLGFFLFWLAIPVGLIMFETHLSGTIIICGIAAVVLIIGGLNMKWLFGSAAVVLPLGALFVWNDNVRRARVASFLNPFSDPKITGYQVVQGLYAIGSGGLFGLGLGQSVQKYTYLPEPYNDFIFAIICEELGFVGAILIMALFAILIFRGIKIALNAPDTFGMLTVVGIMAQVGIQTIFNIAVVTSSIPNTGVTLPFFSYGGTALLVLLAEMGVVLNVSKYSKKSV